MRWYIWRSKYRIIIINETNYDSRLSIDFFHKWINRKKYLSIINNRYFDTIAKRKSQLATLTINFYLLRTISVLMLLVLFVSKNNNAEQLTSLSLGPCRANDSATTLYTLCLHKRALSAERSVPMCLCMISCRENTKYLKAIYK